MNLTKIKRKNKVKKDFGALPIVMLVILCLYTLILFLLLIWGTMTAFKSVAEFNGSGGFVKNRVFFPTQLINETTGRLYFFENVGDVIERSWYSVTGGRVEIDGMVIYSVLYSVGCALTNTLVPFITAYACARYNNIVSKILVSVALATMAIPVVGSEPASIKLVYDLGMYDTIFCLWIMKANYLGIYFLVFYAAFKAIPKTYSEAATIDGAGDLKIMTRICMPLCSGEFFTVLLINFITFWNDYQTPMLYQPTYRTISWNTFQFASLDESAPIIMTSAIIVLIPVIILFLIFQKRLLKNLNVGGIKG